jgi:hypothetical protein
MWVMDRAVPTEEILQEMRDPAREIFYLVGTPKGKIQQYEKKWLDLPWQKVRDSVDVKLFEQDGELYVLAKSAGRKAKDRHCAASVWPACSENSAPCGAACPLWSSR